MQFAIIGYGKMGHAVESAALRRNHQIVCTIDNPTELEARLPQLRQADVAIEFSTPATAAENIRFCLEAGIAIVCGTTGWYDRFDELAALCREKNGTLFTATNFSIGMNIMFALNERLAELMRGRDDYAVSISETHHIHKLDAPSGTAITLQQQIAECGKRKAEQVPITSYREGEVPGTHTVCYDSAIDTITLTHEAHSREGLAQGALLAAEWVAGKKGIFTMKDILK